MNWFIPFIIGFLFGGIWAAYVCTYYTFRRK